MVNSILVNTIMPDESSTDRATTSRATMPTAHNPILERRTVENANRNLLDLLKPGIDVLDVGCGTGAITRSIADLVGPDGQVLGTDVNDTLPEQARQQMGARTNLRFETADIYTFDTDTRFDLINCARTLQWLTRPQEALANLRRLLKPGGYLALLDYNHEKMVWNPAPPDSMRVFYDAFLRWRADAGFDNAVANRLTELLQQLGFSEFVVSPQHEISKRADPDFTVAARLWADVAELRGPQLVQAGYVSEAQRLSAIADYDHWLSTAGESTELYLLAVAGRLTADRA